MPPPQNARSVRSMRWGADSCGGIGAGGGRDLICAPLPLLPRRSACQALFMRNEYVRGWGGDLDRPYKGTAYSNLIFPQPNFGSRFFLGGWVSEPKDAPPPLPNKQSVAGVLHRRCAHLLGRVQIGQFFFCAQDRPVSLHGEHPHTPPPFCFPPPAHHRTPVVLHAPHFPSWNNPPAAAAVNADS